MLYEKLMMDSAMLSKFKLFKRMTQLHQMDYSIQQLADELALNYQQTASFLNEIDKEINTINSKQTSFLTKAGKIDSTRLIVTIDDYRYFLLQSSIPFQFIIYFLNQTHPTIDDFCEKYYVSRSTVDRKMLPLKKHVKKFNLRFTYTEANLVGDERVVRVALFNSLWLGTRGSFWPFTIDRAYVEKLVQNVSEYFPLSKTYLGSKELTYFAAIFLCRTSRKSFVSYDKRYNFLMEKNPYYDFERIEQADPFRFLSPEQRHAECSFIFFLAHYAPFYTLENDPSLIQTLHDFSQRKNPVYDLTQAFLTYAKKEIFYIDQELADYSLLLGNLINITFTFYVLQQPFPDLENLVTIPAQKKKTDTFLEAKIKEFIEKKSEEKNNAFLKAIQRPIIRAYKNILLPYYDAPKYSEHLKIGIAFEHNFILVRKMYRFLDGLGFADASPFEETKADEYDLVISSSLLPLRQDPNLPLYFWDLSSKDEELSSLYKKLQQLFEQKNIIS
ncbi:helix-turn-helix domain-containing protein [Enterococcus rivorum]|uniref:M protein trans-acting positive regulator n=1 Tax=Enterococcus rivorum TaxID=762845 RepID=A0A1E5L1R6_9ENTE|nr:helix-turn-helix domain-containing protein [Enterococcus rivorum]MBP2097772.1 hypothetical protein [Enterococcus rivorum]OEH84034.1 M protein trans-acting positive regulator [Enterococcus rivorum]